MATEICDLVKILKIDVGDLPQTLLADSGSVTGDEYFTRVIEKTAIYINRDLLRSFSISGITVSPDLTDQEQEAYLLMAHIFICSMMRTITARNVKFKSSDKEVDKTKQPEWWENQEKDLMKQYKVWVRFFNPNAEILKGQLPSLSVPTGSIYEQGIRDEDGNRKCQPGYP